MSASLFAPVPSIRRLRVICQKEKLRRPDDLTRKHRAVSIYATWLLVRTDATADQVTIASIAAGLAGAAALAQPSLVAGLLGVGLCYASFLFDQVDGEVARYRRRASLRGVYLDELRHLVIYAAPLFARAPPPPPPPGAAWPFAIGFAGALGLALARIEERLPALLFGERAARLVTTERPGPPVASPVSETPAARAVSLASVESPARRAIRRALGVTRWVYEALAHQVLILFWLLGAVVVDRGLGRVGAIGLEGMLLLGLSLATIGALLASIASRTREGELEGDVRGRALATRAALIREATA